MPQQASVSFVVIAYNEAANIGRALAAIVQLEGLGDYEVIVVDDGSSDGTEQIVADVATQNPRVHPIRLTENRGRGYARSRGIAAARGDLIATVDADIILPSDWLVRAREAIADHDAIGGIAMPDGDVAYIAKRFRLMPRVVYGSTAVTGNNGLYRRKVFSAVGFDPTLREGEDVALNYAMKRQGLSAVTVPGLLVRHEEDKSLSTSVQWLFETGQGATRQLLTYREVRQPDLVAGAFVGAIALGAFLARRSHGFLGAAIPVGFVAVASAQHVRSRFETPPSHWSRVAAATAIDSIMLTAYFAGRLTGLTALLRPAPALAETHALLPGIVEAAIAKDGLALYLQRGYYTVRHDIPTVVGQPRIIVALRSIPFRQAITGKQDLDGGSNRGRSWIADGAARRPGYQMLGKVIRRRGCHDRNSAGQSLEHRDPESLASRREDEHFGCLDQCVDLFLLAYVMAEVHRPVHSPYPRVIPQFFPLRAIADDAARHECAFGVEEGHGV